MKPDTAAVAAAKAAADGEPRRRGAAAAAVGRAGAQTSPSTAAAFTPNATTPTRSDSSARFGARQGQR